MVNRAEILDRAKELTCGQRDDEYGSPKDNMDHIAAMWTAYLWDRLTDPLTGADVAWMNANIKQCRSVTSPKKRDHYDDGAAYVAIAGEVADAE